MTSRRILILGAGGFVGSYLFKELSRRFGSSAQIMQTSRRPERGVTQLDVSDYSKVRHVFTEFKPTHIVNLAGIAAPMAAREFPEQAWKLHAISPEMIGKIIIETNPDCWLLHVSTGLVYGRSANTSNAMTEETLLQPMDTYTVTKAAGDIAVIALREQGLKCAVARPFNHIGPEQRRDFVVASFAGQLADIKLNLAKPTLNVGNLDAMRDFLDVRDVVAAYADLLENSDNLKNGETYNVSSGRAISIRSILEQLIMISELRVDVEIDPKRQRPSDIPKIYGISNKLHSVTGWVPRFSLEQTLVDTYNSCLMMP